MEFIFFIVVVLTLFCKVSWIFRANAPGSREFIVGFHNEENVDVVLCGGSTLYRYYQPLEAWHQKGFTSYNYATASAKTDLLKEYIEESRTTNEAVLYICDIRNLPFVDTKIEEQSLRNWSDSVSIFSPIRIKGISSFLFSRNWENWDVMSFYFDIAKYHSDYEALGDDRQWAYVDRKKIHNVNKGFLPMIQHISFEKPEVSNERGKLTRQQEKALVDLLDYCDHEKLEVLFIVCPYIITEADCKMFNTCEDMVQDRGYNYINFNYYYDEIGFDFKTDFLDANHVNFLGAEKYTLYLTNYISNHYEIPDHRGDMDYSKWDDDYEVFSASQKEWKENTIQVIDQHLEAKELGEKLKNIDDFSSWYEAIQNDNFTFIVEKNEHFENTFHDKAFDEMLSDWKIDMAQTVYIGLWTGEEGKFSSNKNEELIEEIGIDGGRGTVKCSLIAGDDPHMLVGGVNYYSNLGGIQVIVFDNNDQKIVDNVTIRSGEKNRVELVRRKDFSQN